LALTKRVSQRGQPLPELGLQLELQVLAMQRPKPVLPEQPRGLPLPPQPELGRHRVAS
jgi:hypothetical protein